MLLQWNPALRSPRCYGHFFVYAKRPYILSQVNPIIDRYWGQRPRSRAPGFTLESSTDNFTPFKGLFEPVMFVFALLILYVPIEFV